MGREKKESPIPVSLFDFGIYTNSLVMGINVIYWHLIGPSSMGLLSGFIKRDNIDVIEELLDRYFIWIEFGIILGARIWYILFYDPNTSYYLSRPWEIFNPFHNGDFIGIRGMSYHGAVVGAVISSYLILPEGYPRLRFI